MAFVPPPEGAHCNRVTALADASSFNYGNTRFIAPPEWSTFCSVDSNFSSHSAYGFCTCVLTWHPENLWHWVHVKGAYHSCGAWDGQIRALSYMLLRDNSWKIKLFRGIRLTLFCIHSFNYSLIHLKALTLCLLVTLLCTGNAQRKGT
jgi:hypothetical protein